MNPYDSTESRGSPRGRSPGRYSDGRDSAPFNGPGNRGSDGGSRLSDARSSSSAFTANRENFRDSSNRDPPRDFSSREPPRGPKALIDAPSGPRANTFTPDYRGRGRGGRSLSWRDDSRDRGRIGDRDYRDRRDDRPGPPFRDDRSRDRDWVERDRRDRDTFRARRPTPPPVGRARSPLRDPRHNQDALDPRDKRDLIRDARDIREPMSIDVERPRRNSRDGPLSAGSSTDTAPSSAFSRNYRAAPRGRGRGDWDRNRGRYFDDHRRSRSPERWNRDERDRDRDRDRDRERDRERVRDADTRDWEDKNREDREMREREAKRYKTERAGDTWSERPGDRPGDRSSDRPVERLGDRPNERPGERLTDRPGGGSNERAVVRPANGDATRSSASPRHDAPAWTHDTPRDDAPARRPSSNLSTTDIRRASIKSDLPTRVDLPRDRFAVNPSPPPQAPQVPAFGATVIPNRSNVTSATKVPPTGPKADRAESAAEEISAPKSPTVMNPPPAVSPTLSVRSVNNVNNVPTGPRAERELSVSREGRPTSRQWVRPGLHTSTSRSDINTSISPTSTTQPISSTTNLNGSKSPVSKSPPKSKLLVLESRIRKNEGGLSLGNIPQGTYQHPLRQVETQEHSDSDSGDEDLDDSYFSSEMAKVKSRQESIKTISSLRPILSPIWALHEFSAPYTLELSDRVQKLIENESLITERTEPETALKTASPQVPEVTVSESTSPTAVKSTNESKPTTPPLPALVPEVSIESEKTPDPDPDAMDVMPTVEDVEETRKMSLADEVSRIRASLTEKDLEAVRPRMKTPPISSLPFGPIKPWQDDTEFLRSLKKAESPIIKAAVTRHVDDVTTARRLEIQKLQGDYRAYYKSYRVWCNSADPVAIRGRKRLAERRASKSGGSSAQVDNRPEGRRTTSRFATEHDIERVLRESEREAREKEEKIDREAMEKAASDKEAVIPDMLSRQEMKDIRFEDTSELVAWDRTFAVFEALPPIDNFTEEEAQKFESTFLEFPKQWGRIADVLPGRTFQDCIQHYYMVKHTANLREKLRTQPRKRRRARAKPKSNALTADLKPKEAEGDDAPEGETIAERRRPRRAAAPTWNFETGPSESEATPTPGRRGTPKGDPENPQPKKARKTGGRERGPKGAKTSQATSVTSAAASPAPRTKEEDMLTVSEWHPPKSAEPDVIPPPPSVLLQEAIAQTLLTPDRFTTIAPHEPVSQEKAPQTSSYWSVPEQNSFPGLLAHYGTDWQAIAKAMTSKTATMVKNYYQRQIAEGGPKPEWKDIAEKADQQRARGEATAPPPPPAVIVTKRRHDTSVSKPILPPTDPMEDTVSTSQSVILPPQLVSQATAKLPILAQATSSPAFATQPQPSTSKSSKSSKQQASDIQPAQPRPRGPPRGYFNTDGERGSQPPSHVPIAVAKTEPTGGSLPRPRKAVVVDATPLAKTTQPLRQQDTPMRDYASPEPAQIRTKQEPDRLSVQQYEPYSQPPATTTPVSRELSGKPSAAQFIRAGPPQPPAEKHRRGVTPVPPTVELKPQVNDPYHRVVPPTTQTPPAAVPIEHVRSKSSTATTQQYTPRNPMMSIMSENAPVSASSSPLISRGTPVPAPMSAPPSVREQGYVAPSIPTTIPLPVATPAPPPAPRAEPIRKTSNIMSLLNDDPPPPPKRVNEVSAPPVQSSPKPVSQPPPVYGHTRQLSQPGSGSLRREPPVEPHTVGYARQSSTPQSAMRMTDSPYAQPQSRPHASSPMETPGPERDYYSRQPAYSIQQQPPASASPQMAQSYHSPHTQHAHRHGVYEHHNPSPPTQYSNHPAIHSSRTNNFDARQSVPSNPTPGPPPQVYAPPPHQGGHYGSQAPHPHSMPPSRYSDHRGQPSISQPMPQHAPVQHPSHQAPPHGQHTQHPSQHPYSQHQPAHMQQAIPPPSRSYTPAASYDSRGYPPPPHASSQSQDRDQMMRMQMMGDPGRRPHEYEQQQTYDRRMDDPYARDRRYEERR